VNEETTLSQYLRLFDEISSRFKIVTGFYILYLVAPIYTLILFEKAVDEFQNLLLQAQKEAASRLIEIIVENFLVHSITFFCSLFFLALALLLSANSIKKLGRILETRAGFILSITSSILLILSLLIVIYLLSILPAIAHILKEQLEAAIQSENTIIQLKIPYILEELIFVDQVLLTLVILVKGISLRYLIEESELLQYMKTGAILLIIGGCIELIEMTLGGLGIGPIIIALGFLLLTKKKEIEIKQKWK